MERIPTGIKGFDELMEGGLPKGSSVVLSGPCGAGKIYFAGEFLYRGGPSIFYTFERDEAYLKRELSVFNWNLDEAFKKKHITVITSELYQFETFLTDLEDNIDKYGAERVVLDSLTVIGHFFESTYNMRKGLIELRRMINHSGATALMISEIPSGSQKLSSFGIEEFVLDGLILLHVIQKDSEIIRSVSIRRLIGTNHDTSIHPWELTKNGIRVHRIREIF